MPPHKPVSAFFRLCSAALCVALTLVASGGQVRAEHTAPELVLAPQLMSSTSISGYRTNIVSLTNQARIRNGVPALRTSSALTNACQAHANDMAKRRLMSHTGSDGSNGGTRATRYGFRWSAWGENVAAGYMSSSQVVSAWMNSWGHRANMLSRTFTYIGIGVQSSSNGTPYFCMLLARPG